MSGGYQEPTLPKPRRVDELPKPGEGMYFARTRPAQLGVDDVRQVGDAIPEAFEWPERSIHASLGAKTIEFKKFVVKDSEIELVVAGLAAKTASKIAGQLGLDPEGKAHDVRERITRHLLGL